ncbi:MAG: aminotransferase class I/II-fold pyridoxal phosphate-dependent enzyme, partial [Gammaproteobacteria bacterium]|nr:aminotransferase class I/II-fold pyridoxal phosphate-dependent enzyme [Gammaproteobacteria bacterium]
MELSLSGRARNLKPSPTLAVTALAASLRAAGKDIIGLGAGEPDFDTPDHIKAAAIKAIEEGFTKYTAVDGTAELKAAIITKFARDNKLEYKPDQIIVSCGGKHSFYNLAQALLNPGDEVIIPAPYWVSYPPIVELAEGVPIIIEGTMAQGFKITPEQLEA